MEGTPERVEKYILATIALHNYLRETDNACFTQYLGSGIISEEQEQIKTSYFILWKQC